MAEIDSTSGTVTQDGYKPYGETGSTNGSYRYTSRRIDAETNGLYYYRARMYNPAIGRFMQPDPIGYAGGKNLYAYVGNDPFDFADPFGLAPDSPSLVSQIAAPFYELATNPLHYVGVTLPNAFANLCGGFCDPATQASIGDLPGAALIGAIKGVTSAGLALGSAAEAAPGAYSVFFETTIGKLGIGTRASHFTQANKELNAAMEGDAEFAAAMREGGVEVPTDLSRSPSNFTWHHVPDRPGVMQLVPRAEHQGGPWQSLLHPGNVGGFKLWGSGY